MAKWTGKVSAAKPTSPCRRRRAWSAFGNAIRFEPCVTPANLAHRIGEALTRHAEDAAKHIEVAVGGDVATLHGNLDSWAEHAAAFGAVWSAPGVSSVVDQVRVRPTR